MNTRILGTLAAAALVAMTACGKKNSTTDSAAGYIDTARTDSINATTPGVLSDSNAMRMGDTTKPTGAPGMAPDSGANVVGKPGSMSKTPPKP
jgi:hypothetical protein